MNNKYEVLLVEVGKLRQHEEFNEGHLDELMEQIENDGCIKDPIIVDKNTMVILDGHHRFNVALRMGLARLPVCLVDYQDAAITVGCWREGEKITKEQVVAAGISGKLLKPKTSRHFIPDRPVGFNFWLKELRC